MPTIKKHPSIVALMNESLGQRKNPEEIIREKARSILSKYQCYKSCYNIKYLASLMGIKCTPIASGIEEGAIIPYKGRFQIFYRDDKTLERQNFTIAHELAHTLFPDFLKCIVLNEDTTEKQDKAFEKLCDIGASEFLMPYDGIMRDLSEDKLVLGKIFALHKKYNVSIEALCYRISELTDKPICFAFLQEEILYGEKRYRIRYAKTSRAFKTPSFKIKNTLLLKHTVTNSASFSPCDFNKEKEILYINNRPRGYYVEPLLLESFNGSPSALLMLHSRLP